MADFNSMTNRIHMETHSVFPLDGLRRAIYHEKEHYVLHRPNPAMN